MMQSRTAAAILGTAAVILGAGLACGQNYPYKPLRIVTAEPGGSNDFLSRLVAQGLSGSLGQQVIVDNRPSGVIPGELVSRSAPDGYTMLLSTGITWILPFIQQTPFDPVRDFLPITLAATSPNILVVHPAVAVNSVRDLIALAKARPGELNYASGSTGSASHLAAELFKSLAGVNLVRIPYKSAGPGINDLIGGQVQLMFATAGSVTQHIKSGRLRAVAVTSAQPSALLPGLPTVAASGVSGYQADAMFGILAPAGTPAAIISRLNQEIVKVLNRPDVKEKIFNAGVEVVGSSPPQFAAAIKSDMARMGRLIRDAGIRAD